MKMTIAALMLTAATIATPAMAQTYDRSQGMSQRPMVQSNSQSQMGMGSEAYAYAPRGWANSSEIRSPALAMDPDPSVRTQLQIQSDITDR